MTKQENKDYVWVQSPLFGEFRIQREGDEIIYVSDFGGLAWTKSVQKALEWVEKMEEGDIALRKRWAIEDKKRKEERELLWAEEDRKRRQWLADHWVCLEGGDGYYDPR